ncbi:hypothetical protein SPHINGO391_210030 [Sphingomonas aurantiaca]|uniref:Uncharacterized protein n=1 Tax=Sphingomonas aurantiaca TaxID=185949 RepID=A0A5E7XV37_9SPHN|nr:hypothetical protein [Sphingomonas aurantiaca]VVS98011.1 hypothetical protein SPHINGO391_210030 [Sphingomonas aurantiaca]
MELGFGQLLDIVAEMHPGVDPGIVSARLKYFQRLPEPFPSKATVIGAGARAEYSADDLLGLVLAFEVLASGIAPLQAATLVRDGWKNLSRSFAKAWAARALHEPMVVMMRVEGLGSKRGAAGSTTVGDEVDLRNWAVGKDTEDRRLVVFEMGRVARSLDAALSATQPFKRVLTILKLIETWRQAVLAQVPIRRTGT